MAPWSGRVASEASAGPIDQVGIPWAPSLCSLCLLPEDEQREKSVSHQTVQQLVLEKEQALADLNSVEKSLADLFRRYEKMKEVLEGFRKVCWCSGPEQEGCAWGRAGGGSRSGEMWGVLDGRLCPPSGATPNPRGLDSAVRGYTCICEFVGFPALLGISSVALTPGLCRVRMKRC